MKTPGHSRKRSPHGITEPRRVQVIGEADDVLDWDAAAEAAGLSLSAWARQTLTRAARRAKKARQ